MDEDEGPETEDTPERAESAKRRQKRVAEDRQRAMRELMATKHGRELLSFWMHDMCGVYKPVNAAYGTEGVHFYQGARSVGLTIRELALQSAPDQYMVLLAENVIKG